MKVLMISSGTNINFFKEGSSEQERMKKYGDLVDELHVVVFSPRGYEKFQLSENVWVYPTNSFHKLLYVRDGKRIGARILEDKGKWLVTCQDPFEAGLCGLLLSKRYEIPLEIQVHGDIYSPHFTVGSTYNILRRPIGSFVLPRADHIRVVSERIKKSLLERGIEERRVDVLPVHVDLAAFLEKEPAFDLHEKYPHFKKIILMVSRLEQEKDIPTALEAFKFVSEKYSDAGLVIVGSGRLEGELKSLAHNLGIEEQVVFEGWQNDLVSYYKTADGFLNTSLHEGYARTLVEAAASGLAIVSTDVGLVGEVLKQGESIEICDIGNGSCIGGKLDALLSDDTLRVKMGEHARKSVVHYVVPEEEYLRRYKDGWVRATE